MSQNGTAGVLPDETAGQGVSFDLIRLCSGRLIGLETEAC